MTNALRLFDCYNRAAPVIREVYRVKHRLGLEYAGPSGSARYGLLYTLGGRGYMSFDGDEGIATSNTVFHGGVGCWHEYGAVGDSDWEIIIIAYDLPGSHIDRAIVGCHFESYQTPELKSQLIQLQALVGSDAASDTSARVASDVDAVVVAGRGTRSGTGGAISRLRANSLFYDILSQTLSNTMDERKRDARALYDEACTWIRENCAQDLDIPSMARHFQVPTNGLYSVFRKVSGRGPAGLVHDCRFKRACELLGAGGMSVAAVASQVGYADAFSFSKQFKKRCGVPPSAFQASGSPCGASTAAFDAAPSLGPR
jgi:AraC-like DNA-binding protein